MSLPPDHLRPAPNTLDLRAAYAPWYLPDTTYADHAVKVDGTHSAVTYAVPDFQCGTASLGMITGTLGMTKDPETDLVVLTNAFTITDKNTQGHFRKDTGLTVELFPGYQGVGSIMQAVQAETPAWLTSFKGINFQSPLRPGDAVVAKATILSAVGNAMTVSGEVRKSGQKPHTVAKRMIFEPMDDPSLREIMFPQHKLIEVVAQMAGGGAFLAEDISREGRVPFYEGLGSGEISHESILPEDILLGQTEIIEVEDVELGGAALTLVDVSVDLLRQRGNKTMQVAAFPSVRLGFIDASAIAA